MAYIKAGKVFHNDGTPYPVERPTTRDEQKSSVAEVIMMELENVEDGTFLPEWIDSLADSFEQCYSLVPREWIKGFIEGVFAQSQNS